MRYWIVGLVLIGLNGACEESSEIGLDLIDNSPQVYFTDTVTVSLSTIIIDSIPTNGLSRQLVGTYHDQQLGSWNSSSYFQIGLNGNWAPEEDHIYDSLRLVIHYDGYWYGDTLNPQTLQVYRITELYEPDEGTRYYNTSSLQVDPLAIGSIQYLPRPTQHDSLIINISEALGLELFNLAQNNDQRLSDLDDFLDFFRGIKLQSGGSGAVIGFETSPEQCYLELYYHERGEELVNLSYRFPLLTSEQQFNAISGDRTQTALANLDSQRDILSAAAIDELSLIQAGTGVVTRIEFPYIENLVKTSDFRILTAQLQIVPLNQSSDQVFPYPQQLVMARSDDFNTIGSLVSVDYGTGAQVVDLERELEFSTAHYQFSLTEYLDLHLYQEDQGSGLLLTIPSEEFARSAHRLQIDGLETKLLINYLFTQ